MVVSYSVQVWGSLESGFQMSKLNGLWAGKQGAYRAFEIWLL